MSGYVYVLHNEIYNYYGENVFKIGYTKDLSARVCQYKTYYIKESKIVYSLYFEIASLAEQQVHILLNTYRLSDREFFDCSLEKIIENIEQVKINLELNIQIPFIGKTAKQKRKLNDESILSIRKDPDLMLLKSNTDMMYLIKEYLIKNDIEEDDTLQCIKNRLTSNYLKHFYELFKHMLEEMINKPENIEILKDTLGLNEQRVYQHDETMK